MIIIEGKPQGKARPRMSTRTGKAYTLAKTRSYENLIRYSYTTQGGKKLTGAVKAKITAFYEIPKSTTKAKREKMLTGEIYPLVKPDLDNVVKAVLDSVNKIAYDDDSQVVEISVKKLYSDNPRIEVEFEMVKKNE